MKRIVLTIVGVLLAAGVAEAAVGEMDITWQDNSTGELGFTLERAVGAAGVPGLFSEIARVGNGVQLYVDRDPALVNNTQYCYRVRAFNAGGFSGYATVVGGPATFACATFQAAPPPPPPPPVAPSNLSVR